MHKGYLVYSVAPIVFIFCLFFFPNRTADTDLSLYLLNDEDIQSEEALQPIYSDLIAEITEKNCYATPVLGKTFIGFKEALAFKESSGNYSTVNTLGYLGKYQFGTGTLKLIGINDPSLFLKDPELQEKAFIANTMRNKWVLRRDIKRFVGKHIDGILITESGILAAAHLAGPGSVKKYLRSYGAIGFTDAYGTTIRNYMKRFSGYDTSFILADKKAKASRI